MGSSDRLYAITLGVGWSSNRRRRKAATLTLYETVQVKVTSRKSGKSRCSDISATNEYCIRTKVVLFFAIMSLTGDGWRRLRRHRTRDEPESGARVREGHCLLIRVQPALERTHHRRILREIAPFAMSLEERGSGSRDRFVGP